MAAVEGTGTSMEIKRAMRKTQKVCWGGFYFPPSKRKNKATKTEEMRKKEKWNEKGRKESVNTNLGGDKEKMKTKNKAIALLEIAIVLCSLFLVATLPAAAITNYESGITNYEETASEDDYVLDIYGNANEDDTIDMRDLTYVKLIFFGKKPATELADAKYDGKVNPLDFIQIKLIIVGKEKELTLVDSADRIVMVKKPIKRVVSPSYYSTEAIRMLGAKDKIVGVSSTWVTNQEAYFPEISKLPYVGYKDYEAILSLNPDLVTTYGGKYAIEAAEKLPGVTVVGSDLCFAPFMENLMKLGYIFDKEDEATHYVNDFHDKYIGHIKARTESLSEEERPKVYEEAYSKPYQVYPHGLVEAAGGRDIFGDLPTWTTVDPEAVIERNPDIIIKKLKKTAFGYVTDDLSKAKEVRDEVMSRPELAHVSAVENGRVYVIAGGLCYGPHYPIPIAYYAKWFHPDLFENLDPRAIHQEYLEFHGLDFNVYEHGVWAYPLLEE